MLEQPLIADRACGPCNVCCISLTIDDPQLRKHGGVPCVHTSERGGCAIYDSRPDTCRSFHCGWRTMKWIRANLRPDVSGVLVRQRVEVSAAGETRIGVIFTLLHPAAAHAPGLPETVAAAVQSGVDAYVSVLGPPGFTEAMTPINDAVLEAVVTRDKAAMLQVLQGAYEAGRAGPRKRVKFPSTRRTR